MQRTILPNVIRIRFETTDPYAFLKECRPKKNKNNNKKNNKMSSEYGTVQGSKYVSSKHILTAMARRLPKQFLL